MSQYPPNENKAPMIIAHLAQIMDEGGDIVSVCRETLALGADAVYLDCRITKSEKKGCSACAAFVALHAILKELPQVNVYLDVRTCLPASVPLIADIIIGCSASDRVVVIVSAAQKKTMKLSAAIRTMVLCAPGDLLVCFFLDRCGLLFLRKKFSGDVVFVSAAQWGVRFSTRAFMGLYARNNIKVFLCEEGRSFSRDELMRSGVSGIITANP